MYIRVLLLLLVCGSSSLCSMVHDASYVKQQLEQISVDDKQSLTLFFETFLTLNGAYTLFGDKPLSHENYYIPSGGSRKESYLKNGLAVWKKHRHLFALTKFAIKIERKGDFENIYLINKGAFLQATTQHLNDFQAVLGKEFEPHQFLSKLIDTDASYMESLGNHTGLIGTLFGFGRDNAFMYYNNQKLTEAIDKYFNPPFLLHGDLTDEELLEVKICPERFFRNALKNSNSKIKIPDGLRLLLEDDEMYTKGFRPVCPQEGDLSMANLTPFPLPAFGAISSAETCALLEKYTNTRHSIIKAYSDGDFLEVTLCKLIEK